MVKAGIKAAGASRFHGKKESREPDMNRLPAVIEVD